MRVYRKLCALTAAALFSLVLTAFAANEVYIKNRLFKGSVSSAEGQLWVELPAFAKAIGANLVTNEQGGHVLSLEKVSADGAKGVAANTVMIAGSPVEVRANGDVMEVPLEKTAKLLNAKVIANKAMGTVDVNLGGPVQAVPPAPVATKADANVDESDAKNGKAPSPGGILRVTGKVTLPGANAVGLFENGSASVPYKKGKVDAKGNYVMEIDPARDMHDGMADMRFYMDGSFETCHGRCNFIFFNPTDQTATLSPHGMDLEFKSKNGQLQYTEPD